MEAKDRQPSPKQLLQLLFLGHSSSVRLSAELIALVKAAGPCLSPAQAEACHRLTREPCSRSVFMNYSYDNHV